MAEIEINEMKTVQEENEKYDASQLTKAMRWQIADWLAEERLADINAKLEPVHPKENFYSKYIKRLIDIIVSAIALIVTSPINLVLAIGTFFDVGRPILFKQTRTGKDGKEFTIVKFRNMTNETDEKGELLPASQRVTKWGRKVRKSSLDELLNFWSIFKGDMSLIGPRPLLPEHYDRFNDRHKARFIVRPGLECPPKDKIDHVRSLQEQFENDIWYVENISFLTDCKMVIRLIQFAMNRKSVEARADIKRGIFMGYDENGIAINLSKVPYQYIERAYREVDPNKKV